MSAGPMPRIRIAPRPQDMRAGIEKLALEVSCDLGGDPSDGSVWCFVSADCRMVKALRFHGGSWCLHVARPPRGTFRWKGRRGAAPVLSVCAARFSPLVECLLQGRGSGPGTDAPPAPQ